MKKIIDLIEQEMGMAFEKAGYDRSYARAVSYTHLNGPAVFEQPFMSQYGRCGTDRGDERAVHKRKFDHALDGIRLFEMQRARHAARQHHRLQVFSGNPAVVRIGSDQNAVSAADKFIPDSHRHDLQFQMCIRDRPTRRRFPPLVFQSRLQSACGFGFSVS